MGPESHRPDRGSPGETALMDVEPDSLNSLSQRHGDRKTERRNCLPRPDKHLRLGDVRRFHSTRVCPIIFTFRCRGKRSVRTTVHGHTSDSVSCRRQDLVLYLRLGSLVLDLLRRSKPFVVSFRNTFASHSSSVCTALNARPGPYSPLPASKNRVRNYGNITPTCSRLIYKIAASFIILAPASRLYCCTCATVTCLRAMPLAPSTLWRPSPWSWWCRAIQR